MSWLAQTFWALIATLLMTGIMEAGQGLGFSRMSLPFLIGTWFTGNRMHALVAGTIVSIAGGAALAFGYFLIFARVFDAWWFGVVLGLVQGLVVLLILLPALPYWHPRIAIQYDSPTSKRRIEPPGFFGLNYGLGTPAVLLVAQIAYGGVLTLGRALSG